MSILSDAFKQLTGGSQQNMTTTSSTQMDPLTQEMRQYGYDQYKDLIDAGFQRYNDPRFADFNTDQMGAMSGIRDTVGAYTGPDGRLDQAYGVASGVGSYTPDQVQAGSFLTGPGIDQYMNPYNQAVIDAGRQDLEDALKMGRQTVGQAAMGSNAFGSERQGVAEGVMANKAMQDYLDRTAMLRQQGFESAARRKDRDIGRDMAAQTTNVGSGLRGAGLNLSAVPYMSDASGYYNAFGQQMGIGDKMFGLDQAQKDFDYGQFQAEQNFIPSTINSMGSFMNPTAGSTTTTTSPMYRKSPLMNMMGLGLAGLGGYGMYKNAFGS